MPAHPSRKVRDDAFPPVYHDVGQAVAAAVRARQRHPGLRVQRSHQSIWRMLPGLQEREALRKQLYREVEDLPCRRRLRVCGVRVYRRGAVGCLGPEFDTNEAPNRVSGVYFPDRMADTKAQAPVRSEVKARWTNSDEVRQILANEANLTYINDQVYLSFGQLEVPPGALEAKSGIEIRSVARLVLTTGGFHKILKLLNAVADRIPNPNEEGE